MKSSFQCKIYIPILLFFFFTAINVVVAQTIIVVPVAGSPIHADYDYMMRLLGAFTPTPPGWSNNTHFCKWKGIVCDESSTSVLSIKLPSMSLKGELPPGLNTLWELTHLDLHNNSLTGSFPILRFLDIKTVYLGHNNFSFIPNDCFSLLKSLQTLNLSNNLNLENWVFPRALENSRLLRTLDLEATNIIGNIDSDILEGLPTFSNLKDLVNLTLSGNNLTGSIPESLTTLSNLQLLDVSNNNLSGKIPKFPSKVKLIIKGNALLENGTASTHNAPKVGGPFKTSNGSSGSAPTVASPSKPKALLPMPIWITGASLFSIVVAVLTVIICKRKRYLRLIQQKIFKKTRSPFDDNIENFIKSYNLLVPKRYSYAQLKKITNSFQDNLGRGGYGVVYKGKLLDGREVAVKVIKESKGDGEEFINEVASISRTLHVNIVSLLGFCYEKNKRALIYEFMANGSLDKFLYKSGFPTAICTLDWNTLHTIAIGIARGLEYLHQGCISRILHLDIKPQNILLGEDFCPKISDFGLAKICQKKDSIVSLVGTRGTIGYIAPEVFSRAFGGVSHKSDVYSYGMLILEMIGGRKNHDTGGSHTTEMIFPDWIYNDLEQGNNITNCVSLSEEENDMVRKIAIVSLWCIQTNPLDRPSMSKVMEMLQAPLDSLPYPPKPVLCTHERPSIQISQGSSNSQLETTSAETL